MSTFAELGLVNALHGESSLSATTVHAGSTHAERPVGPGGAHGPAPLTTRKARGDRRSRRDDPQRTLRTRLGTSDGVRLLVLGDFGPLADYAVAVVVQRIHVRRERRTLRMSGAALGTEVDLHCRLQRIGNYAPAGANESGSSAAFLMTMLL